MVSFFFFLALSFLSAGAFVLGGAGGFTTAVLLLIWAGFGFVRVLRIARDAVFRKVAAGARSSKSLSLAGRLLSGLSHSRDFEQCVMASRAFRKTSLFWLGLGVLYVVWIVCVFIDPRVPANYAVLADYIREYFRVYHERDVPVFYMQIHDMLQAMAVPCLIGVVFMLSLTFSYSRSMGAILLKVAPAFFLICIFVQSLTGGMTPGSVFFKPDFWTGYGPGSLEVLQAMKIIPGPDLSVLQARYYAYGLTGVFLLYLPGFYTVCIFIAAIGRGRPYAYYALSGIAVMAAMLACDIFCSASPAMTGVWIFGWMCAAALLVRSRNLSRKIYQLYQ